MRWNAFAATLGVEDYSRLVNLVTAGRGHVFLASRLAEANADAPTVVAQVDQALHAFRVVGEFLRPTDHSAPISDPRAATPSPLPALPWRAFLQTRPPTSAPQVRAALTNALDQTERLVRVITANGEVAALRHHLASSVACLHLIRQLCQTVLTK